MNKKISGLLAILLFFSVGCSPKKINFTESIEVKETIEQIDTRTKRYTLTEEEWMNFFKAYFSFTEEELLILNQKRTTIDEVYWRHLRQYYGPLIQSRLGKFLTEDLAVKLESHYLFDELTLPKWVFMNQYMIQGKAKVEKVESLSARDLGNHMVYEVAVTTVNACYPVSEFISEYTWGEEEGYFIKQAPDQERVTMILYETNIEEMNHPSYLYSQEEDEIKLEQHFWITVSKEKPVKITSVQHAQPWKINTNDYKIVLDSKYITRMPYKEEASKEEKEVLNQVVEALITADRSFCSYYKKAYDTSASTFQRMWEDNGLSDQIDIQEAYYKEAFPISILPYKDEIVQLTMSPKGIQIKSSAYSTKQQSRYVVTIPVEALLNTNQKVYYNYKYFIGMEDKKIKFIQWMSINEIEAEDYIGV